jgi:hypothetical protein
VHAAATIAITAKGRIGTLVLLRPARNIQRRWERAAAERRLQDERA